jgi:hypothetical protein
MGAKGCHVRGVARCRRPVQECKVQEGKVQVDEVDGGNDGGLRRSRRTRERSQDAQAVCLRRDIQVGRSGRIRAIQAISTACGLQTRTEPHTDGGPNSPADQLTRCQGLLPLHRHAQLHPHPAPLGLCEYAQTPRVVVLSRPLARAPKGVCGRHRVVAGQSGLFVGCDGRCGRE